MDEYNGVRYEIVSFTITDMDEAEIDGYYEGYAVEYADEEDIRTEKEYLSLEEANTAFYSDENSYYMTRKSADSVIEFVLSEIDSGRVLAVSHLYR